MKIILLMMTLIVSSGSLLSQTDEFNLAKYWKFRNDYVEKFVKIGPLQGESLPAGKRKPCTCIDTCKDMTYNIDGNRYSLAAKESKHDYQ